MRIDNDMNDKELLLEAIDNYDLLTPKYRIILKALIELAIDNVAIISVVKLSEITNVSRPVIYKALEVIKENQYIEQYKKSKNSLTSFIIKPIKLQDIVKYYKNQKNVREKYLQI